MAHALSTGSRKPYAGPCRSLVLAIDVGTTFSGVSYAILEPGDIPKIHGVTRFPGQEHVAGNTKIPSVIYYDRQGTLVAAGAEADTAAIVSQAEDEGWTKVELFKLRLRPRTMRLNMNGMRFSRLPNKKTGVHVFGDFLSYLYLCTKSFITDTHANGAALWNTVESHIQFVLSHPNGWEGPQQSKMRRAAIYGKLIPDTNAGKARIWFVTEGEASLHACVLSGLAADVLSSPSQHGFLIADAGGGTLDISSYGIKATSPLVIEEIAPPDCIFAGSVFVSRRAREFLEEKLKISKYGTPDALDHITKKFDETTKRLFRDKKELQFIAFGSPLDKDLSVGIRSGQLKLTGLEVANLFEPSVEAAVDAIKAQIDASRGMIKSVFLVGGYAASPWLFSQLQERLGKYGVAVSRPDSQTSKAVADGAVGFFCDHHVSARMSKFMYGVEYLREFDQTDPDHIAREDRLCELPSGPKLLPDAFDCILARGVQVKESTVFTRKYSTELTSLLLLSVFEVEIWCFRGGNEIPTWIDRQSDAYSTLCIVQADLSLLSGSAEPKVGRNGRQYWTIVFSVEIHFGLTEFKARIKWVDNGNTKYGPATIIYNEHGHRAVDDDEPDMYPEDDHSVGGGTPRSERLRSLPASRARSPTDPYYPDSQGGNDGGDANIIRGIPPPAAMPHPHGLARERTLSKPTTPKAMSPTVPQVERERTLSKPTTPKATSPTVSQIEREPSRQGRRDRGTSSRASSVVGARIGETLSSVWGAGDPQLRSPMPQSPQTPTQQPPQPPIPQSPTPQPPTPQPPTPQPPSQPRSQQNTPKQKSRKSSMSAFSHAMPQPSPPRLPPPLPQSELAALSQPSPRPPSSPSQGQAASSRPLSAQASPRSAHASPRSSILPSSRGLSRVPTPQKQENPLSPLNPSAQAQLELGVGDKTAAPSAETWATDEEAGASGTNNVDFGTQDAGWNFGESHEGWGMLGGEDGTSLENVPGTFDSGGVEGAGGAGGGEDLLIDSTPLVDPTGGPTLLSGSISSLMSSNPVSGLSHKLSSFGFGFGSGGAKNADTSSGSAFGVNLGLGGKKPDDIELMSGIAWGSSAAKAAAGKAGAALGSWGSASSWGKKPQSAAGSKAATPSLQSAAATKAITPNLQSAAPSKAVTPNPPATPHIPEQAVQSAQIPPAVEKAAEEAGLVVEPSLTTTTEGKPAEEPELAGDNTQAPVIEEKTAEAPERASETSQDAAAVNEKGAQEGANATEVNPALAEAGPQDALAEGNPEEVSAPPVPEKDSIEPLVIESKPEPEEQAVDAEVTAPDSLEEPGWGPVKKKKGKKGKQTLTEPSSPVTPKGENAWPTTGKKGKQAPTEPPSPTTPTVESAWSTSGKKGKKGQTGWATMAQELANESQGNENGDDGAELAGEQPNGQGEEQSGDAEFGDKQPENTEPTPAAANIEGQDESGPTGKPEEEGQGDDEAQAPPEGDGDDGDEEKANAGTGKKKKKGGKGPKKKR